EVYVSPIELDRESADGASPTVPALRVGAPVYASPGHVFGAVIIDVDLRPAFSLIRSATRPGRHIYVVNERGDYLVHPDARREFAFEFGNPVHWQAEFPEFARPLGPAQRGAAIVTDASGARIGAVLASARLAQGPRVGVIETIPYAELAAPAIA